MKVDSGFIGVILLFLSVLAIVMFVLWPKNDVNPVLQGQVSAVSSAGVSATSVVAANSIRAEAVSAQVRKGTRDVQSTSGAKDSMGDTGLAGIAALCSMSNYSEDPSCKLQQSGAQGLEGRSITRPAPSG